LKKMNVLRKNREGVGRMRGKKTSGGACVPRGRKAVRISTERKKEACVCQTKGGVYGGEG